MRELHAEIECSECGRRMRARESIALDMDTVRPARVPGWLLVTGFLLLAIGVLNLLAWLTAII